MEHGKVSVSGLVVALKPICHFNQNGINDKVSESQKNSELQMIRLCMSRHSEHHRRCNLAQCLRSKLQQTVAGIGISLTQFVVAPASITMINDTAYINITYRDMTLKRHLSCAERKGRQSVRDYICKADSGSFIYAIHLACLMLTALHGFSQVPRLQ